MSNRLTWKIDATAGERVVVSLLGELLGDVPPSLVRALAALEGDPRPIVVEASHLDRVDTPGIDALRAALAPLARVRANLPSRWTPAAHLLHDGLAGSVALDELSSTVGPERRRHRRYRARVTVRIALPDGALHDAVTADVSCGGVCAILLDEIPASRTTVHAAGGIRAPLTGARVHVELPSLGLAWRGATVVGDDLGAVRQMRIAFDAPCADLFGR